MAQVGFENVSKIYPGNVWAVKDLNLNIRDKEFLVLVGPSGCGKTTSLRMVAGLEHVSQGKVTIGDRVVNDVPPKHRDIAMVFQNYALYPHMTVRKNMSFGLRLRRFPKAEIEERVNDAAEILGLKELLDRKPKELSGGQRQRVAVGRAIVRKPQVFLFDEPLSNLDAKLRVEMRAELNKLHKRLQTTMIYVTHDQIEAMTLGDRIVVMDKGVVQQAATPLDIYDRPANRFVAGFVGTPPMNFSAGRLERGNRVLLPEALARQVSDRVEGEVVLGVRPEHVFDRAFRAEAFPHSTFQAEVKVVEPLGDEQLIYLSTRKSNLVAKMDPHHKVAVGRQMEVVFDMTRVHLFAPDTGQNLTLGRA